jgi:hypothetical protein
MRIGVIFAFFLGLRFKYTAIMHNGTANHSIYPDRGKLRK